MGAENSLNVLYSRRLVLFLVHAQWYSGVALSSGTTRGGLIEAGTLWDVRD